MPVSSTATVTPWPVSPAAASWVAPVSARNASDGACGPSDSAAEPMLTDRSGVTWTPGRPASAGSVIVRIDATTPLMRWNLVRTLPPTSSTAWTGLRMPFVVTMTSSVQLADAFGAVTADRHPIAHTSAAPVARRRPAFAVLARGDGPPEPPAVLARAWPACVRRAEPRRAEPNNRIWTPPRAEFAA